MIRTIELATLRTPLSSTETKLLYSKPVSFLTKWLHRKVLNLTEAIKERRSRDCNQLKVGRWKGPLISKGPLQLDVITYPGSGSGKKKTTRIWSSWFVGLWINWLSLPEGGTTTGQQKMVTATDNKVFWRDQCRQLPLSCRTIFLWCWAIFFASSEWFLLGGNLRRIKFFFVGKRGGHSYKIWWMLLVTN